MAESGFPLLSVILWVPLAGAALVLLTRGRSAAAAVAMLAALPLRNRPSLT